MKKLLSALLILMLLLGLCPAGAEYVPERPAQTPGEVETVPPIETPNPPSEDEGSEEQELELPAEETPPSGAEEDAALEGQAADTDLWKYLEYDIYNGEATVTGCEVGMMVGELTIPATVEGVPVTAIGNRAFWGCNKITKVTLPDTLKSIGEGAFYLCGMTEITIPSNVVELGVRAFSTSALTKIVIPSGISVVPESLCEHCPQLAEVWISDTVRSIEKEAFISCTKLKTIRFAQAGVLENIGVNAFGGAGLLESVSLPDSLVRISGGAFGGAGLTAITIPANVTYLAGFNKCTQLKEVTFAPDSKLETLGYSAFELCTALTELNTPPSLRVIENGALVGIGIADIVIPEGVVSIGDSNFGGWLIKTIAFPSTLTDLSTQAFDSIIALTALSVSPQNPVYSAKEDGLYSKDGKALLHYIKPCTGKLLLPEGIEVIGSRAFIGYHDEEASFDVVLPSTVKRIDPWAFQNSRSLRSINIPEGVTTISNQAFYGCNNLSQITLHDGITEIGEQAFFQCAELRQIHWPAQLKTIGKSAFSQVIMEGAVPSNEGLSGELTLPENLKVIGEEAFFNCQITKVNFPASLREIGNGAFRRQTELKTITGLVEGLERIGDSAFAGGFGWDNLTGDITIPDSVTYLGKAAFQDANLLSVTVGKGITKVPDNCFAGNNELRSVQLPDNIAVLEQNAFAYCGFEEIRLPDVLMEIGPGCFSNCVSLKELLLPDSLQVMGINALGSCTALTKLRIPKNLGKETFLGVLAAAENLETIEVAPENPDFKVVDNVLFTKDGKDLLVYPPVRPGKTYTVPAGTERLKSFAFNMVRELETLILPSNPIGLENWAVSDCPKIRTLTIPANVILDNRAVEGLASLEELRFEEGLEKIRGFMDCPALTTVTIPGSVTYIGDRTFQDCTALRQVTFIEGQPLTIGAGAFAKTALEELVLPGTVGDFSYCFQGEYKNLSRVVLLPGMNGRQSYTTDLLFGYSTKKTEKHIYLPSTVARMPDVFTHADDAADYTYVHIDPGSNVEEFFKKHGWKNYTYGAPPDPWQLALGVKDGVCSARAVHLGRDYENAPTLYLAAYRDGKMVAIDSQTPLSAEAFCTLQLESLHGVTLKAFLLDPLTLQPVADPATYDIV